MRSGLLAFGALQVVAGVLCGALLLGLASRGGEHSGPVLLLLGAATLHFIATGVGSMRARRSARALSLVVAAMWLVGGVLATLAAAARGDYSSALVAGLSSVLVPLAMVAFYARRQVREFCELQDPAVRWTDRVPLPVLAVVLVLAFAAAALVANLSTGTLPLFGTVLTGATAVVASLAFAFLFAFLAMQVYRLKQSAWWTIVLLQIIGTIGGGASLFRASAGGDLVTPALTMFVSIAYFAFLLWLHRYFNLRPRTRRGE